MPRLPLAQSYLLTGAVFALSWIVVCCFRGYNDDIFRAPAVTEQCWFPFWSICAFVITILFAPSLWDDFSLSCFDPLCCFFVAVIGCAISLTDCFLYRDTVRYLTTHVEVTSGIRLRVEKMRNELSAQLEVGGVCLLVLLSSSTQLLLSALSIAY